VIVDQRDRGRCALTVESIGGSHSSSSLFVKINDQEHRLAQVPSYKAVNIDVFNYTSNPLPQLSPPLSRSGARRRAGVP
jgi:hypothetical protein